MEYQAVGTNEDAIAQINERIVLTTTGIAQLKELCDKMEQATKRVVWGICGELGKKGVADFANEQLNTGVDMTKPQPCTKYRDAATTEWVAKLCEETTEVIQEAVILEDCADEVGTVDHDAYGIVDVKKRLATELTDVITLCTSWLYAIGYDEYLRGELQRRVNEKNKARGYF